MQHRSRRAAWIATNVAAILAVRPEPYPSHSAAAALAARMELRRRLSPAEVDAAVQAARA